MGAHIINVSLAAPAWARLPPAELVALARQVEAAGATSILLEDPDASAQPGPWRWDSSTAVGALAGATTRLGLIVSISSSYTEPFSASRRVGTLDHLSGERAGWVLDPSETPERSARTRAVSPDLGAHDPLGRAVELAEASRALWDEWEDGAFALDVPGNVLVDGSKIHPAGFQGRHFRVAGPSNLRRPPSGHPPLVVRLADAGGLVLAGVADVVLAANPQLAGAAREAAGHRPARVLLSVEAASLRGAGTPRPDPRSADGLDLLVPSPEHVEALLSVLPVTVGEPPAAPAAGGLRSAFALPTLRK